MVKEFESEEEFWKFHNDKTMSIRTKCTINPWYYYIDMVRCTPVIITHSTGARIDNTDKVPIRYRRFDSEFLLEIKEFLDLIASYNLRTPTYQEFIHNQKFVTFSDEIAPGKPKSKFRIFWEALISKKR